MKTRSAITPYLLVAPAVIWVVVFALWPFINTVILSFTNARPLRPAEFIALDNYTRAFSDERLIYALTTSFLYVLLCVPLLTFIPLLLALLVKRQIPGITVFRTTFYFPVIASVVVVGIIWQSMFNSVGTVNQTLMALGLADEPVPFLVDRWLIILTAALLTVWKGLGYYMVVYLAALAGVNSELYEAAAIDGANKWRRFWSVTVPGVRGAMLLVSALISVSAMRIFSEIYVLTNGSGGPGGQSQSLVMLIQQTGKGLNGDLGYASAQSVLLFFLTIAPLLLVAYINQGDHIRAAVKRRRAEKPAKEA